MAGKGKRPRQSPSSQSSDTSSTHEYKQSSRAPRSSHPEAIQVEDSTDEPSFTQNPKTSNLRDEQGLFQNKKPLSKTEEQHFAKLAKDSSASVGLKMLQKMGWKTGTGLGTRAEGIVTPLETKLRPKGMGLSYKGFEERTTHAKEEDRRNGKIVDDEEDHKSRNNKKIKKDSSNNVREAWKDKPKPKKDKPVPQTYEQIINKLDPALVNPGLGEIIDLTGRKLPSLNTTLIHHSKGPTQEENEHQLPELLHNLSLICDISKGNLIHLAKEGNSIKQKSKQLAQDRQKSEKIIQVQQQKLSYIKKVVQLVQLTKSISLNINNSINLNSSALEICQMLNQFDQVFDDLMDISSTQHQTTSGPEFQNLKVDEIIVGALAPILRQVWSRWDVLNQPDLSVAILKRYRKCFLLQTVTEQNKNPQSGIQDEDIFQHPLFPGHQIKENLSTNQKKMTAYESLIWNDWMPKIRSAINNNDRSPIYHQSEEIIQIYKSWNSILPKFVNDNFLDQLILPKLLKSIEKWNFGGDLDGEHVTKSTNQISLHLFVFPWLELMGPYRTDLILEEVKIKVSFWLKSSWKSKFSSKSPDESSRVELLKEEDRLMIKDLLIWKNEVLKRRDWDKIILKSLIPNLANYLRLNLIINPKKQNLEPFKVLMDWSQLITNQEMLNQLLMTEFFSKWIDTLWIWLTSASANGDQIGEWFRWWKSLFPESLLINRQSILSWAFGIGQELMNQAKCLSSSGVDLKTQLIKPDLSTLPPPSSTTSKNKSKKSSTIRPKDSSKLLEEITFKSIVQEEVEKLNLILIPMGKNLDSNGKFIFRISNKFESSTKNSLSIYIDDDVVFVKNPSSEAVDQIDLWEPMLLEDMLQKALAIVNSSS